MKFKFKKRRNPWNVFCDWTDAHLARVKAKTEYRYAEIEQWTERYAWHPVRVNSGGEESSEWILFEKYYEKGDAILKDHRIWSGYNVAKGRFWERYSAKDFFKKKLAGEIITEDEFVEMSHDGTNTNINVSGTSSVPPPKAYVKKADKNDDTAMWG